MRKKFDYLKFLTIFSLVVIPFLIGFFLIVINNSEKFSSLFKTFIVMLTISFVVVFIICFSLLIKQKRIFNKNNLINKFGFCLFLILYSVELFSVIGLFYYNDSFKEWLISSSFTSINYKSLATDIYSQNTVDEIVGDKDAVKREIIDLDVDYNNKFFANEVEKELLDHEEEQIYKLINISGTTIYSNQHYEGYLVIVYDPSHLHLAKSQGAGNFDGAYGQTLSTIARNYNALIAMNAGGFYDPNWSSNGGIPHGDVFIDGKLDSDYPRYNGVSGGLIAFTEDNKMVLKRMTSEEAANMKVKNAVDWGPFLIVDGKYEKDYYYYLDWDCPRSVIGQREDGTVLLLVIDGLQQHSAGASYRDLIEIMLKYGAVNAANLDGGTSASMVENGNYVNSPFNGQRVTYRYLPNAWIVTE